MSNDTCRYSSCDNERRSRGDPEYGGTYEVSAFGARFCSTRCELRFEHVRADARDAKRSVEEEAREDIDQ